MLSFATEFAVDGEKSPSEFLGAIRVWLLGSRHTSFVESELSEIESTSQWSLKKSIERLDVIQHHSASTEVAGVRYTRQEQRGLEWTTTVSFLKGHPSSWVGVRITVESQRPSTRLPAAKKPVLVRTIINSLGGGCDGDLVVRSTPHLLANSDVDLAARAIAGKAGCRMPVVYVSARFHGGHDVPIDELARNLCGMAHVLVEPNRPFSYRLMEEVAEQNVYGGTVGIYWPDAAGRRSFFIGDDCQSPEDLLRAVEDEVRTALTNRRPMRNLSWAAVQEYNAQRALDELRSQSSPGLDEYINTFDEERKAAAERRELDDQEIRRLNALVQSMRRVETHGDTVTGLALRTANEQDLYPGELRGIVMDALRESIDRVAPESRRQHVLRSIVKGNAWEDKAEQLRREIKELFKDYRRLDARVRGALQRLGFEIFEDGKHYKILFQGDDRYTFTLPKSGSDHRGGKNLASDIGRLLF
jgi:hypothetical protein